MAMRLIPTSLTQRNVDPNDPTGGMTIDALRARQVALQQAQSKAPAQIASPWQGAAFMADRLVNNIQQRRAADAEAAGRQRLAQLMSGINYDTGASPAQIAGISTLDPELGTRMVADAIRARRELLQQQHQDSMTREGWGHEDKTLANRQAFDASQTAAAQAHSDAAQQAGFTHQDQSQKSNQDFEAQQAAAAQAHADTSQQATFAQQDKTQQQGQSFQTQQSAAQRAYDEQKTKEARDYQSTQPLTDVAKLDADLKAGRIDQATYDAQVAKTGPDNYGPIVTGEAATAIGLDPTMQWQQNLKTKKWEKPAGSGINIQTVPAEVGARVALGDDFLNNVDEVRRSAKAGEMTGPIDYQTAVTLGRGPGGNAARLLTQGSEALIRQLTGAGKSQSEAESQAKQFLPTMTDDADTLTAKVDSLERQLRATRIGSTAGRKFPEAPPVSGASGKPSPASGLPKGVTEDDIQTTMRANNMTRDQVLKRLGGGNGGP